MTLNRQLLLLVLVTWKKLLRYRRSVHLLFVVMILIVRVNGRRGTLFDLKVRVLLKVLLLRYFRNRVNVVSRRNVLDALLLVSLLILMSRLTFRLVIPL